MNKFNVEDKVSFIRDNRLCSGVVIRVIDVMDPAVLIVKLADESVVKIRSDRACLTPEEKKSEPTGEGKASKYGVKKITIEEYNDAFKKVTSPDIIFSDINKNPELSYTEGMIALMCGRLIRRELFGDKTEIDLDKDNLKFKVLSYTLPSQLARRCGSGTASDFLELSKVLSKIFNQLIKELFAEAEND